MRSSITLTSAFLVLAVAAAASPVASQQEGTGKPQLQKRIITTVLGIGALAAGSAAMHAARREKKRLRQLEDEVDELEAQVAEAERRMCFNGQCRRMSPGSQRLQANYRLSCWWCGCWLGHWRGRQTSQEQEA